MLGIEILHNNADLYLYFNSKSSIIKVKQRIIMDKNCDSLFL